MFMLDGVLALCFTGGLLTIYYVPRPLQPGVTPLDWLLNFLLILAVLPKEAFDIWCRCEVCVTDSKVSFWSI